MKKILLSLATLFLISSIVFGNSTINLQGTWAFKTDPTDIGITEKWFLKDLDESIKLPGSMTTNGKGNDVDLKTPWIGDIVDSSWFYSPIMAKYREAGNFKIPFWLQPVKYYAGAAWYQKTINIDKSWEDKYLELFLERCHWESRVWIDDIEIGMKNSLGAPHVYNLSKFLTPGKHKISIRIDNRIKNINVGVNSHSISDHTQSNWNGIIGRLELRKLSPVHISNVKIFPDIKEKKVHLQVVLINITGKPAKGKLQFIAKSCQTLTKEQLQPIFVEYTITKDSTLCETEYPMGKNPLLWDEFHPNLYKMQVSVSGAKALDDVKEILFGMREIKTNGTQIVVNNRPVFLRGTLECSIFPETGYPPTDTASWMRIFRVARAHGLNHIRFHSWCPPEAAFEAADYSGVYLHIECSSWANQGASIGDGLPVDKFIYDESGQIISNYGNHPSFCILLYGNEPAGKKQNKWLGDFVSYWKKKDARRLYSSGAGWPDIPENDLSSSPLPRIQGWGQGLKSIINGQAPRCDYDWSNVISQCTIPTVSHEIGQWCVYPDFKEINQYSGVLKAKNFEIFKETLEDNHMGHLADSFLLASGKLQALCYRADIEAALRTPGFGGFQLLDLHDFPGQGTALVGILNPFWREKGYITPKEFGTFCNATVPLIRLPKMIFNTNDTIKASVEIAHFGENSLNNVVPVWKIINSNGNIAFEGKLKQVNIPTGSTMKLGNIVQPIQNIIHAQKYTLVVTIDKYENQWDIWIYPSTLPEIESAPIVTQTLDEKVIETLINGGNVLLTVKKGSVKPEKGGNIAVGFSSIFWNTSWTSKQAPHTLGILCNPKHPALENFPSEYHSNWQWWDAMSHSNAIILSGFSTNFQPIVRVIDDWFTNRPLALIFEAKVGKGKLLVSGIDLLSGSENRPEARQLLFSLKKYMSGPSFNPQTAIEIKNIKEIFNL